MSVGGKGFSSQTFTAFSSWVAPAGVTQVILIGCGGGQGGGGGRTSSGIIPVGGKGAVPTMKMVSVVPNTSYFVNIGLGGTGGLANGTGASGQTTFFGSTNFLGPVSTSTLFDPNIGVSLPSFNTTNSRGWISTGGSKGTNASTFQGGTGGACGTTGPGGNGGNANLSGTGANGGNASSSNYGAGGGAGGSATIGSGGGGKGGTGAPGFLTIIWVEA